MPGVERLMVVKHPLAANPEDVQGPGIVQRAGDFLRGFGITPDVSYGGAVVGFVMEPGLRGLLKGVLIGSLCSMTLNWYNNR
jgi:hypothetical protein